MWNGVKLLEDEVDKIENVHMPTYSFHHWSSIEPHKWYNWIKKNNSSKINKLLQLEMVDVSIFPLIKEPVAYGALGNKFFLMIQSSP